MRTESPDEPDRTESQDERPELRAHGYITTFTGARFDYSSPGPFRIRDIARSLSYTARFRGHTRFFYSVAQHSLYVSDLARAEGQSLEYQLAALMHDAHEAYVGDVPTPLKWACPEISALEYGIALRLRAELMPGILPEVFADLKRHDDTALHAEAGELLKPIPAWVRLDIPYFPIVEQDSCFVERDFLERAAELGIA